MRLKACENFWKNLLKHSPETQLTFAITHIPSQDLIETLKRHRNKGRNDYPLELLWKSLLSKLIQKDLPTPISTDALYRFVSSLSLYPDDMEKILEKQIQLLHKNDSSFGKVLILSRHPKGNDFYLFDGNTGLPLIKHEKEQNYNLTAYALIEKIAKLLPNHLYNERFLVADETFDDEMFSSTLWNKYQIKSIVEFNSKHPLPPIKALTEKHIQLNPKGEVLCHQNNPMICTGFEKDRNTLKFQCLLLYYGKTCENDSICKVKQGIRIPLNINPRIFTPLFRSTDKWEQLNSLAKNPQYFYQYLESNSSKKFPHQKKKKELLFPLTLAILYAQVLGSTSLKKTKCDLI